MSRRYVNTAIVYALLGLAGGVFFREYTKALGFSGDTVLSVVHAHYLTLGMGGFLLLAALEHAFSFSRGKGARGWLILYHVGLNGTVAGLLARGVAQAQGAMLSPALDAALSGVSGLFHLALGAGLLGLLFVLRRAAGPAAQAHP